MQYLAGSSSVAVRSDKSYVEMPVTRTVTVMQDASGGATIAWRLTWVLLALAVYRFWIAPLTSSFWLDETGTLWAIRNGPGPMLAHIREWPTVTALYGFIVWAAYAIGGAQ